MAIERWDPFSEAVSLRDARQLVVPGELRAAAEFPRDGGRGILPHRRAGDRLTLTLPKAEEAKPRQSRIGKGGQGLGRRAEMRPPADRRDAASSAGRLSSRAVRRSRESAKDGRTGREEIELPGPPLRGAGAELSRAPAPWKRGTPASSRQPRTPLTAEPTRMPILACVEQSARSKRQPGDEQRHREADAAQAAGPDHHLQFTPAGSRASPSRTASQAEQDDAERLAQHQADGHGQRDRRGQRRRARPPPRRWPARTPA